MLYRNITSQSTQSRLRICIDNKYSGLCDIRYQVSNIRNTGFFSLLIPLDKHGGGEVW